MLVRQAIEVRLSARPDREEEGGRVRLPRSLKRDRLGVRTALFQRLAASRLFALGDRSGVLRAAQGRSGRAFRLDVRQRVIVKALVCRHEGKGAARGGALARHVSYLGRGGAGVDGAPAELFDRTTEGLDAAEQTAAWGADRHHFRFIVSPEHGERIADLKGYVRDVIGRVAADLGEPELGWLATCHFDTDQPHAHVLVTWSSPATTSVTVFGRGRRRPRRSGSGTSPGRRPSAASGRRPRLTASRGSTGGCWRRRTTRGWWITALGAATPGRPSPAGGCGTSSGWGWRRRRGAATA